MTEDFRRPPHWTTATLGDVCERPQYGWTTKASTVGSVHLLRTTDITGGAVDWDSVPYCTDEPPDVERYLLGDDDIVISRAGSIGFSRLVRSPRRSVFASYLIRFRPKIEPSYVAHYLQAPAYWRQISEAKAGIALLNVNARKLEAVTIPLPPLPEQRRIVAKIEELFTRLDAGVAALQAVKQQIKRYRQAVLRDAFTGKLTEEWRERELRKPDSPLNRESAAELLRRIGCHSGDAGALAAIGPRSSLPSLPEGWCWADIGSVAKVQTGATPKKGTPRYYDGGRVPWVTSAALNDLFVSTTEAFITEAAIAETNAKVFPKHTLLVAMYGEGKTRGKVSELLIEAATNQACAALVLEGGAVALRPFLKRFLLQNYEETRRLSSGGVQPNLNLGLVKSLRFPVSPLAEQEMIVQEIDRHFSLADFAEKTVDESLAKAARLRQSILKQAFEGKLVPQDPDDEPAEKLLGRIRRHESCSSLAERASP